MGGRASSAAGIIRLANSCSSLRPCSCISCRTAAASSRNLPPRIPGASAGVCDLLRSTSTAPDWRAPCRRSLVRWVGLLEAGRSSAQWVGRYMRKVWRSERRCCARSSPSLPHLTSGSSVCGVEVEAAHRTPLDGWLGPHAVCVLTSGPARISCEAAATARIAVSSQPCGLRARTRSQPAIVSNCPSICAPLAAGQEAKAAGAACPAAAAAATLHHSARELVGHACRLQSV